MDWEYVGGARVWSTALLCLRWGTWGFIVWTHHVGFARKSIMSISSRLTHDAGPAPGGVSVVGRYAPSPTGALHLGNLRTALAAWLSARAAGGRCLLRVDDLDLQRSKREFEEWQLADLARLGLEWDGEPIRQSARLAAHDAALGELARRGHAYRCFCSRREIQEAVGAPHGSGGATYPGTCAGFDPAAAERRAAAGERHCWRMRVAEPVEFVDAFAGPQAVDLRAAGGDFVIRRADGCVGYQLACALDEADLGVTEVVRGADLLESAARQIWLLRRLDRPEPIHAHIPLLFGPDGRRLAKRIGSEDLSGFVARGHDPVGVRSYLAHTLGLCEAGERPSLATLVERWSLERLPREDSVFDEAALRNFREEG